MAKKLYKEGSFIVLLDTVTNGIKEFNSANVQISKSNNAIDQYEFLVDGTSREKFFLSEVQKKSGVGYTEEEFDEFRYTQCGAVNTTTVTGSDEGLLEAVIEIPSSEILTLGTSPKELLPVLTNNEYYNLHEVIIEFTQGGTSYDIGTITRLRVVDSADYAFFDGDPGILSEGGNFVSKLFPIVIFDNAAGTSNNEVTQGFFPTESSIMIKTIDDNGSAENPTLGDGTLRVIVRYKKPTFGA